MADADPITHLLDQAREGDAAALERLLPLLYEELRRIAVARVRDHGERSLQPTDVVHEAFLKLLRHDAPWSSRRHFYAVASRAMRSILVDRERARRTAKRGGAVERVPLDAALAWFEERSLDLLALDEALHALEALDPRKREVVELRFFCGMSLPEVARTLSVSLATAEREWAFARAFLARRTGGVEPTA